MIEACHGLPKIIDGCLMNIKYVDYSDMSKRTLDEFDYRNSSYEGLKESEYFENNIEFGENTEPSRKLV